MHHPAFVLGSSCHIESATDMTTTQSRGRPCNKANMGLDDLAVSGLGTQPPLLQNWIPQQSNNNCEHLCKRQSLGYSSFPRHGHFHAVTSEQNSRMSLS